MFTFVTYKLKVTDYVKYTQYSLSQAYQHNMTQYVYYVNRLDIERIREIFKVTISNPED